MLFTISKKSNRVIRETANQITRMTGGRIGKYDKVITYVNYVGCHMRITYNAHSEEYMYEIDNRVIDKIIADVCKDLIAIVANLLAVVMSLRNMGMRVEENFEPLKGDCKDFSRREHAYIEEEERKFKNHDNDDIIMTEYFPTKVTLENGKIGYIVTDLNQSKYNRKYRENGKERGKME